MCATGIVFWRLSADGVVWLDMHVSMCVVSACVPGAVHTGSLKSLVKARQCGGCTQVGYEG